LNSKKPRPWVVKTTESVGERLEPAGETDQKKKKKKINRQPKKREAWRCSVRFRKNLSTGEKKNKAVEGEKGGGGYERGS